jgi:hypothetical protein
VINAIADAVTTSYRTHGSNARSAQSMLDEITGNGKQTYKIIMNTGQIVEMIGGNAYFEMVANTSDPKLQNIRLLDSGNIKLKIKNGSIIQYMQNVGSPFAPEDVLHLSNCQCDSRPYGRSDIEPMQDLLLSMTQIWDDMSRIYHRYIKPTHIVELDTNSTTKQADFAALWKRTRETPEDDLILPGDLIKKIDKVAIPQGGILDPSSWERILIQRMLQSFRTPELALGTGSVNSEESSRMLYSGFRQLVRWKQQKLEEDIYVQVFKKIYGVTAPEIEFSYAGQVEEEKQKYWLSVGQFIMSSGMRQDLAAAAMPKVFEGLGFKV